MARPAADETAARALRPRVRPGKITKIEDSKVGQLLTLLDRSAVPQQLEELLAGRPGPAGVRPRTVLAGLLLAAYYTGRATIAEAWRILHFRLKPKARTRLGIPAEAPTTARECIAASRRLYRGFDRITTVLDPARCDRRSRLPQDIADAYADAWNVPSGRQAAERLQQLANQLVLTPVRLAHKHGHLRGWRGDVGVDATSIPVLSHPASDRTPTAPVEITAGWHYSGGSGEGTFGYSATFVVAAHRRRPGESAGKPTAYPQMCVGLVLDTPTVRTGRNAVLALEELSELGVPAGTCAADRAYTGCSPENFQIPVRRLGYRLALDYKVNDRGQQGSWQGALLVDGSLACPHMPAALVQATHGLDDKAVREIRDNQQLTEHITAREPHYLKTKQGPDARGAIRLQCPAAGPSPSVNCARRDRLRPRTPRTPGPPSAVVDFSDRRQRAAHPAARPTVQLPQNEWLSPPPADELPRVCSKSDITVPADAAGDLKTAKFRQDSHYLSDDWIAAYKPIRSHNEGIHGRLKGDEIDIGNPKHRPAPGQVAQTFLVALLVTAGNLDILETWLYQRTGTQLTDSVFDNTDPQPPTRPETEPPAQTGRPPPPTTGR
ncbi:hypothetical protein QNO09_33360 [Streptomyces sp. 378]|uniref:hypothetical protein n=1 Tax=Streptomyces sp. 378 TaxID=3049412 RepID=UPI0024C44F6B|nr:hypothetical protein [Streptomyces sp. 378]MDK1348086.1 hypothetical protein [Streptomyces sp. 378]